MRELADELRRVAEDAASRFAHGSDRNAQQRRAAGKWSRKEVLGHLIDSASNNHQRFVRATLHVPLARV